MVAQLVKKLRAGRLSSVHKTENSHIIMWNLWPCPSTSHHHVGCLHLAAQGGDGDAEKLGPFGKASSSVVSFNASKFGDGCSVGGGDIEPYVGDGVRWFVWYCCQRK
jgi:hypothetical protein